jgi:hypothetical protein
MKNAAERPGGGYGNENFVDGGALPGPVLSRKCRRRWRR